MNCGKHVFEVPVAERQLQKAYICQDCKGITSNFKYDSDVVRYRVERGEHYGEVCPSCGEQLAVNPALPYKKCPKCSYISGKEP